MKLYKEFEKTGEPFTMEAMGNIEIQAMVNAGMSIDYATHYDDTA